MRVRLRICCDALGLPTPHDLKYVTEFRPGRMNQAGRLDGNVLTTGPASEAREFADASEAIRFWRSSNGVRPDGKPNRPLTAYCVEIEPATSDPDDPAALANVIARAASIRRHRGMS
jgi:hypothetical protein